MKKKKIISLLLIGSILTSMNLIGCGKNNKESDSKQEIKNDNVVEETYVLTSRQKEILKNLDLPQELDELDVFQRTAIKEIEKMLSYLENKYDESFEYVGYSPDSPMGPSHMSACLHDNQDMIIRVSKQYINKVEKYSDDYDEVLANQKCEEEVAEYLDGTILKDHYYLKTNISILSDTGQSYLARTNCNIVVLAENIFESEDDAKKIVDDFLQWHKSLDIQEMNSFNFIVQNKDDFEYSSKETISDQIHQRKYIYYFDYILSEDGSILK